MFSSSFSTKHAIAEESSQECGEVVYLKTQRWHSGTASLMLSYCLVNLAHCQKYISFEHSLI